MFTAHILDKLDYFKSKANPGRQSDKTKLQEHKGCTIIYHINFDLTESPKSTNMICQVHKERDVLKSIEKGACMDIMIY